MPLPGSLTAAVLIVGTTCELTAAYTAVPVPPPVVPPVPPPVPDADWYSPEKYPLNPNGYAPIAVLEVQTPINEFFRLG